MARLFYSPEERGTILTTVADARKSGTKWADVHPLAKASGFRGGLQALMIFVRKSGKKAGKRGRPVGSGKKSAAPVAHKAPAANAYTDLQSAIEQMVQQRVNAALESAIAALRSALQ